MDEASQARILKRVQEEFDVDSLDKKALDKFIKAEKSPGRKAVSDTLMGKYRADFVDSLIEKQQSGDISALRSFSAADSELQRQADNRLYNTAGDLYRRARDSRNVGALQSLRGQIAGTSAEDWTGDIDRAIEVINRDRMQEV